MTELLTAMDYRYRQKGKQLGSVVVPCVKYGVGGQRKKFGGKLWQDAQGHVHYTDEQGLQLVATSHLRRAKNAAEKPELAGLSNRKQFAHAISGGVKTFGKMEAIGKRYLSVHQQNIKEGFLQMFEQFGPTQLLKCNHYFIRSEEELETKRSGDAHRAGVTIDKRNEAIEDKELAVLVGAALRQRVAKLLG